MRLVYLSPVSWGSFSQRPHKFVEWFHHQYGGHALWIEPYPTRLPRIADFRRSKSIDRPAQDPEADAVPHWLRVFVPPAAPIEPIPGLGWINHLLWAKLLRALDHIVAQRCLIVAGKPSALALSVMRRYPDTAFLYDAMDDFPSFYNGISKLSMARREYELVTGADRVFASSTALSQRLSRHTDKLTVVRNACDTHLLSLSQNQNKSTRDGRSILGYVGTIGAWFDWDLVARLAEASPSHLIRLIGPLYNPPHAALPDNVELLPACGHMEAIRHMSAFTVGLIPFRINELTSSVDPIKYYEYRALGLPVISTRFGEMSLRGEASGVYLVDRTSDLDKIVVQAIAHIDLQSDLEHFRQENSWMSRFKAAGRAIDRLC